MDVEGFWNAKQVSEWFKMYDSVKVECLKHATGYQLQPKQTGND